MTIAVPLPTLPFTGPVLITAVAMVVFLVVPLLFERFGVPGNHRPHRRRRGAGAARRTGGWYWARWGCRRPSSTCWRAFEARERREIVRAVIHGEDQFSSEFAAGVALPHVRREGMEREVLVLGVSRAGVAFPRTRTPVRLIFLLVSPAERPDEHLRTLAALARFLSVPSRVEEVAERFAPDLPRGWLHVRE